MEFNIAVPQYHHELVSCMYELQQKTMLCDAMLVCDDDDRYVHKLVLMSCGSPYLHQQAIEDNSSKSIHMEPAENYADKTLIDLTDYSSETVDLLVKMLYTGELKMSGEVPAEFLKLIKFLGLEKICIAVKTSMDKEDVVAESEKQELPEKKSGGKEQQKDELQQSLEPMEECDPVFIESFTDLPEQEKELTSPFTTNTEGSLMIKIGKATLFVAKDTLMGASPVFQQMFTSQFKEATSNELILPEKDLGHFIHFLRHILPGFNDSLTDSIAHSLLPLAHEYLTDKLMEKLCIFLSSSMKENGHSMKPEEVINCLIEAEKYSLSDYIKECVKVAGTKDYEELVKNPKFTNVSIQSQADICLRKMWKVRSSGELYAINISDKWAENKPVNVIDEIPSYDTFRLRAERVSDEIYALNQKSDAVEMNTGKYNNSYIEFSPKSDVFLKNENRMRFGIQRCGTGEMDAMRKEITIKVETIDGSAKAGSSYKPVKEYVKFNPHQYLQEVYVELLDDGDLWEREKSFKLKFSLPEDIEQHDVKIDYRDEKEIFLKSDYEFSHDILPLVERNQSADVMAEVDSFLASILEEKEDNVTTETILHGLIYAEKCHMPKYLEQCIVLGSRKKYEKIVKNPLFPNINMELWLQISLRRWEGIDKVYEKEEEKMTDFKDDNVERTLNWYGYRISAEDFEIEQDDDEDNQGLRPFMQTN